MATLTSSLVSGTSYSSSTRSSRLGSSVTSGSGGKKPVSKHCAISGAVSAFPAAVLRAGIWFDCLTWPGFVYLAMSQMLSVSSTNSC